MENLKTDGIDVVYVLGTGSHWNNNEIRFSLRALEKNLKRYRNVYVVGQCPGWLKNIIHIPFTDELKENADGNIARKVLRVCQEADLSDRFLFINDDHLIMISTEAVGIPPYHKGDLTTRPASYFQDSFWRGRLFRTRNTLVEKGLSTLHYDCHVPMVFDKNLFPEAIGKFDFENNIGYTMKSMYGNVVHGWNAPRLAGEKVTVFKQINTEKVLQRRVAGRQFVAFNDEGLNAVLKMWLYKTFPEQSGFEISCNEPSIEIARWLLASDHDFTKGTALFEAFGKSKRVKKFLKKPPTTARREKLVHQLRELLNYI
jgi:hypothetical protein